MARTKMLVIAPDFYGIDRSIVGVFESLGFDVTLKNTRRRLERAESLALKISTKFPFTESALSPVLKKYLDRDNEEYLSLVTRMKPDVVFVIKGETIYPETLKRMRKEERIPCFAYQWDCPFYSYLGRFADNYRKNNFADGMTYYDHIFSHDPYYVREIQARGMPRVSYLPLATDPSHFKEISLTDEERRLYDFDICFVGAPFANRIEIFESLREFKLGVFGDGWDRWHWLRLKRVPEYYKGAATGEKVLKIYKSSKIVLNIHSPEAKEGANTRTFDIPLCGAFELADYRPQMDVLFTPSEEIVYYKNIQDLTRLARLYLKDPEKRRSVIEKGRARVLAEHTWSHRIQEVADRIHQAMGPIRH